MNLNKKLLRIIYIISFIFFQINNNSLSSSYSNNTSIAKNDIENKRTILKSNANEYLLGPGDGLLIDLKDLRELSGNFYIGPNGDINLPEIGSVYISNYSINSAREILLREYQKFIIDPKLEIFISEYRPIRVYIRGEVEEPGFYILRGEAGTGIEENNKTNSKDNEITSPELISSAYKNLLFPSLYDAIKIASGITPYSDLNQIEIIRKAEGDDSYIKTKINFIELFTKGDLTKNIRLYDGDSILIPKSNKMLGEQFQDISSTNINPRFLKIIISGNVPTNGIIDVPHGSGLIHAISIAGGKKLLSGKIEFLRFDNEGNLERKLLKYRPTAKINSKNNPILRNGDIINIRQSPLGTTTTVINSIASPIISSYSLYNLLNF